MNRLLAGLLIVFLAVCVLAACQQPVGSLANGSGGNGNGSSGAGSAVPSSYDFLMLRPNRFLYDANTAGANGSFDRAADLRVFLAAGGEFASIDPSDSALTIEVVLNPGTMAQSIIPVNSNFPFSVPGRHIIRGTYNGNTDEYSIEVRGSYVNPGPGNDFVGMNWL